MKAVHIFLIFLFIFIFAFFNFGGKGSNFDSIQGNLTLNPKARKTFFQNIASNFLPDIASRENPTYVDRKEAVVGKTFSKSVFYKKIVFGSGHNIAAEDPLEEFIVLDVVGDLVLPVRIDGWKIFYEKSDKTYKIPKSIKKTSPVLEEPGETIVSSGDRIVISSGTSPIGQSLKIHKCLGYREQFQNFNPVIKRSCPAPKAEFLQSSTFIDTGNVCRDFVESLPLCTSLRNSESLPASCRDFVQTVFTESGCITRHHNDPDFLLPEWRLFLDQEETLWKESKSVIILLDEHDNLVDTLVY